MAKNQKERNNQKPLTQKQKRDKKAQKKAQKGITIVIPQKGGAGKRKKR